MLAINKGPVCSLILDFVIILIAFFSSFTILAMFFAEVQLIIFIQCSKWGWTRAYYKAFSDIRESFLLTHLIQKIDFASFAQIYETCLSKLRYSSKYTPRSL